MTNGGGYTETDKSEDVNRRLGMTEEPKLNGDHIIECHTPLRDQKLVEKFRD